jgi:hypothetical protein
MVVSIARCSGLWELSPAKMIVIAARRAGLSMLAENRDDEDVSAAR